MQATLSNFQQSPRKVRLIADSIRGKSVVRARTLLSFADKKSAPTVLKLLDSAVSNARSTGASAEGLFIKDIQVNQGITMKRFMPMSRGQAHRFRRRRATIILVLDAQKEAVDTGKKTKKAAVKKVAKKK